MWTGSMSKGKKEPKLNWQIASWYHEKLYTVTNYRLLALYCRSKVIKYAGLCEPWDWNLIIYRLMSTGVDICWLKGDLLSVLLCQKVYL